MYFLLSIFVFCDISSIACIDLPKTTGEPFLQENPVPEITNKTLKEHHIDNRIEDNHVFYKSWIKSDSDTGLHYWVDLNSTGKTEIVTHQNLLRSYRETEIIELPFRFPFYGHKIDNVTITNDGFLSISDDISPSWLTISQYIAPLMADFNPNLSRNSTYIKSFSNSTTFTVLWENIVLQKPRKIGKFTFEVTLHKNGDIIFVYKNIPFEITKECGPVKIGLSDAYILVEKSSAWTIQRSFLQYHRVQFNETDLKNWTVIYLTAQQTCNNKTTCESCLVKDVDFDCHWCDDRCSSGFDRRRQEWIKKGCDKRELNETKNCHIVNADKITTVDAHTVRTAAVDERTSPKESSPWSAGFLLFFAVICISVITVWLLYAYRNPYSISEETLLRCRPSRWSCWRKDEDQFIAPSCKVEMTDVST